MNEERVRIIWDTNGEIALRLATDEEDAFFARPDAPCIHLVFSNVEEARQVKADMERFVGLLTLKLLKNEMIRQIRGNGGDAGKFFGGA